MEKTVVYIPKLSDFITENDIPLSPVIKAGEFLFLSGLPPLDLENRKLIQGDIAVQTEGVMETIKYALESAGSSMDKVVKATVYATNAAHFRTINEIYVRYFPHNPPARTFIAMSSWPMEFDVEIECIAIA